MLLPSTGFQHRRSHSPPQLDMWAQPPKPPRPSLDLTAPPSKSALPLTPPLTPSSTRRTDSDTNSSRSNSIDIAPPLITPYTRTRTRPELVQWSDTLSIDPIVDNYLFPDSSVLPSPTSPTTALANVSDSQPPTRFLLVTGVPKEATTQGLKQAFLSCGDLKGIFVRFQADHGIIVLAFYDIRHTLRAHRQVNTRSFFDGARLQARFISADDLRALIGQSNFVSANDGSLRIATSPAGTGGALDAPAIQNVLASFGELRAFGVVDAQAKAYHAEFFDARDATSALGALDGRVILHERLHLAPFSAPPDDAEPFPAALAPAEDTPLEHHHNHHHQQQHDQQNSIPFPSSPGRTRRLSIDSSIPAGPAHPAPSTDSNGGGPGGSTAHTRRTSNIYHFDCVGKAPAVLHTPPRPRSISVASETAGLGLVAAAGEYEPESPQTLPPPPVQQPQYVPPASTAPAVPAVPTAASDPAPLPLPVSLPRAFVPRQHVHAHPHAQGHADQPPERNRIDIARIERGDDTRTTVMIKNIPNKMSDRHLIDFINEVSPRKIDFLYLRMDFTNGCNVGYAFVNFIRVEDLLHFAKVKLGTKWNLFSSEKILGMSYANYQGKEALIDKFRSSSIMDQREAWRPKLFYSAGPKRGLPEDFPAPTHLRRKERAGQLPSDLHPVRGALFHHHPPCVRG